MKKLPELLANYHLIDSILEERRIEAVTAHEQGQVEDRQKINDHAYFLLCWGQMEVELNEACKKAIRKRRDNPDWTRQRGWDLYNPSDNRMSGLSFEHRTTLVLDKRAAGGEWSMAQKWYHLRNKIAHGRSHDQRIDLDAVVHEFFQIQSAIDL